MDYSDMYEAVEPKDPGLERIPYPGAESIPLPTDEDGWMDCDGGNEQQYDMSKPNPPEPPPASAQVKKKVDSKTLIQQKLMELKRKAQQEAEKNANERKESDRLNISVKPADGNRSSADGNRSSADQSESVSQPTTESERIIDDLFKQFKTGQEETNNQQGEEMSSTLVKINEEIAMLEKEHEDKLGDEFESKKKKKKKDKKSKKEKKEKKDKKSSQKEDPELDPEFFKVPSPKLVKASESGDISQPEKSSTSSRRRSRSPSGRSKHKKSSDYDRHRDKDRRKRERRSGSRDRHRDRHRESRPSRTRRSRSRSKERHRRDEQPFFIDKEKLRRIAIKRVTQMQAAGKSLYSTGITPEDIAQISSGGASISELTSFCRSMAKDSDEDTDDEILNVPCTAEENDTTDMVQPFSRAAAIVMNIRNAKQLPIQTPEEKTKLRSSFPVSSGTHHRKEEPNEWTPVPPSEQPKKVFEEPGADADDVEDISVLIARRLKAVKKLKSNPNDQLTKAKIEDLDKQTAKWSESKNLPGAFTGRVEAKILTPEELAPSADKRQQAWVKKDTFLRARPIQGGIGQFLLQKMGWNEGQGLGRQNEGSTEPVQMDFNINRKGLTAPEERARNAAVMADAYDQVSGKGAGNRGGYAAPAAFSLSDKHPVSALMEICSRRKWASPQFVVLHESGPSHKKNFIMQVTVNGTTYQPSIASNNKKQAKTNTATVALQSMGMLPKESSSTVTATNPLSAQQHVAAQPQMIAPVQMMAAVRMATPGQVTGPPQPPPPQQDHFQRPHMLSTVPNIDLSSFR